MSPESLVGIRADAPNVNVPHARSGFGLVKFERRLRSRVRRTNSMCKTTPRRTKHPRLGGFTIRNVCQFSPEPLLAASLHAGYAVMRNVIPG